MVVLVDIHLLLDRHVFSVHRTRSRYRMDTNGMDLNV